MSTVHLGVDVGAQKTVVVASDGARVLTRTGSSTRPTAVSFFDRSRHLGEEAIPEMMSENTVTFFSYLLGAGYDEVVKIQSDIDIEDYCFIPYTRMKLQAMDNEAVGVQVSYNGPDSTIEDNTNLFSVPAIFGMYLSSLVKDIEASYPPGTKFVLSFPLPPGHSCEIDRSLREACVIAGISDSVSIDTGDRFGLQISDSSSCIARAYSRKISAVAASEKSHILNRNILLLEMGCFQANAVVVQLQDDGSSVEILAAKHCPALGAFHFDIAIFRHLAKVCEEKHKLKVQRGTKTALRLLKSCERLRKLLSQLPEASVTVENMSDEAGDLTFSLHRDELIRIGEPVLSRFRSFISATLEGISSDAKELAAVEILGGGTRMQVVQAVISEFTGDLPLGGKLDDGSIAVGAALIAKGALPTTAESEHSNVEQNNKGSEEISTVEAKRGMSEKKLQAAVDFEKRMQEQDRTIEELFACRNEMESYIFEMRGFANQKHSDLITDKEGLRSTCDEFENWLWDNGETASLDTLKSKFALLKDKLEGPEVEVQTEGSEKDSSDVKRREGGICSEYLAVIAREKKEVEEELAKEAQQAASEEKEDEDHDFRKLKKPERMRMVLKNKEEGTELFKGGNIRPAAARYQKALTHAAKFFDLSPDDIEEVNAVKLSLHLNVTQCYLKLENWDFAVRHADEALALDGKAVKALFRRAQAFEAKKEYEKSLADLKRAAELNAPKEDKLITKGIDRVKRLIQKEKDKEKKMWGKVFA